MIEAIIQAVIYTTTAIATLRAGSRAIYTMSHDEIGMMDGPLILGPKDISEIREQGSMEGEISPLWESTFGFSEAVRLLHDKSQFNSHSYTNVNIRTGNWKEEEVRKHYYSMASPHKSLGQGQSQTVAVTTANNSRSEELHVDEILLDAKNETRMVVSKLKEVEVKHLMSSRFMTELKDYISLRTNRMIESGKTMKTLLIELWRCHPLSGDNTLLSRYDGENVEDDSDLDEADDDLDLDFDVFYSTTVNLPNSSVHGDGETPSLLDGNDENVEKQKVAHIKAFAPNAFAKLRSRFRIPEEEFLSSLLRSGPYISFQSNSKGAARAGGFFFFSRDGAYMVKTIKKAEIKAILEMLPKYYTFMKSNAKKSLLTRFCGLYSVKVGDLDSDSDEEEERCFLIMNSVFPAEASQFISERFDLKGSTVGRECSQEERESKGSHSVLKDMDLLKEVEVMRSISPAFQLPDCGICIGPVAKAALLSQLRKDLSLLVECSVMDYSLLVGVVNMDILEATSSQTLVKEHIEKILKDKKILKKSRALRILSTISTPIQQLGAPVATICGTAYDGARSTLSTVLTLPFPYYGAGKCGVDGGSLSILNGKRLGKRAVYYMGVIDFLQPWSTQKVLENKMKGVLGYDKSAISCVDPKEYAERFLNFMDKVIT